MVKILKLIGSFLERSERENPRIFWLVITVLGLTFSSFDDRSLIQDQTPKTSVGIEKNVSSVLAINPGGDGGAPQSDNFVLQIGLRKRKKFDITFHLRLEQHFPDWKHRVAYQKKQEDFYKSAMKKKRELKRLRIKENSNLYTKEELDAIDYFQGTGFYQKYQDPKLKPNIFNTRQTFLFKMHDPILRNHFLNSFNSENY
jgi:hypothetical protein